MKQKFTLLFFVTMLSGFLFAVNGKKSVNLNPDFLLGDGTEASPYLISNLDELIFFRDKVNSGDTNYNATGVCIALDADIDMASVDWSVNIGDNCNTTFDGIFDGRGHVIKNLNSTENAQSGDGYVCTGLFGAIYGSAVIKNLTLENININTAEFTGNNASALVGFAYNVSGSVENINVTGDIIIDAKGITGTGVIVGYDYYGTLNIKNCIVNANEGSYVFGRSYVGGIIGYASNNAVLNENRIENIDITATGGATGGVAGIMLAGASATGNIVNNVTVASQHANWLNAVGVVVGCITGSVTVADSAFEGVNTDAVVGSIHVDKPTTPVDKVQAKIGNKYYLTIQNAVEAAVDGDEIDVVADVNLKSQNAQSFFAPAYNRESYCALCIPDDKVLVLDLNGHTVTYVDGYVECDNVMVLNIGDLTINDSEGGGKLTYKPVVGTTTYSKFYSTIFNCGTLTINGGEIENSCETETDVTAAVDNHSRLSHEYGNDCIFILNDGVLSGAYYYAVRQYTHYLEGVKNRVIINGGTVNGGIYMQHGDMWYYPNPESNRLNVDCYLTINGGSINSNLTPDNFGKIKSRLNNPDNNAFGLKINGGNINVPVELLVQRGVYYNNGVSGTTTAAEAAGTRNAEWLETNGGIIEGGTFSPVSKEYSTANLLATGFLFSEPDAEGNYAVLTGANFIDGEFDSYSNSSDKEVAVITYTRDFPTLNWNALYLPFELPMDVLLPDYDVSYINDVRSYDNDDNGTIDEMTMEVIKITDEMSTLKANHPYLIRPKSEEAKTLSLTLYNTTLFAATGTTIDCSSMYTGFEITGTNEKRYVEELNGSLVVGTEGEWVEMTDGTLNPFRLYLSMTNRDGSPVKVTSQASGKVRIVMLGDDNIVGTTLVEKVKTKDTKEEIYDLQGRRVENISEAGIYIVNGNRTFLKKL